MLWNVRCYHIILMIIQLYGICVTMGPDVVWGATVITNLFSAIPIAGSNVVIGFGVVIYIERYFNKIL